MINAILLDHVKDIVSGKLIFNCRLKIFFVPHSRQRIAPSKFAHIYVLTDAMKGKRNPAQYVNLIAC